MEPIDSDARMLFTNAGCSTCAVKLLRLVSKAITEASSAFLTPHLLRFGRHHRAWRMAAHPSSMGDSPGQVATLPSAPNNTRKRVGPTQLGIVPAGSYPRLGVEQESWMATSICLCHKANFEQGSMIWHDRSAWSLQAKMRF